MSAVMLRLYYFPLMAKGLGPALVAELSGLPWLGPKDLGFTRDDWPKLKDELCLFLGRWIHLEPCKKWNIGRTPTR